MAERIQLKEPGSELTMAVSKVSAEQVENIEYYCFANGQKELLVPKSSVLSQLERLNAAVPIDIVGKTVKFSRSTKLSKFGKPFWNLDLVSGAEQSAGGGLATGSSGAPSVEPSDERDKALLVQRAIYANRMKQSVAYVLDNIEPLYKAKGIGMTDDGVYKHAYSIWQEWSHRGIIS